MIHLRDVSKSYYHPQIGRRIILRPVTLTLPVQHAIGILGRNGTGKSTVLRVIAGMEPPDTGTVVRTTTVSWPLGFSGGVHQDLTARENCAFVARIYGRDVDEVIAFVEDFSELGPYMVMPVRTYSSGMRARLSFGLSMAVDFGCYLIDEVTAVGDRWFQDKCRRAFAERRKTSGLIIVSHQAATIRKYCEMAVVLKDAQLVPFDNLDDAIFYYNLG